MLPLSAIRLKIATSDLPTALPNFFSYTLENTPFFFTPVMTSDTRSQLIDDKTYIISIFRDPAEHFVSIIAHMIANEKGFMDQNQNFIVTDGVKDLDIDKQEIYNIMDELKYLKNFQAQNFLLEPNGEPLLHVLS